MRTLSFMVPIAAAVCLACGTDSPERQLAEANERLQQVRAEVEQLEKRVDTRRAAVERAEKALAEARGQLSDAEADLAVAREKTLAHATDVALFRAVQKALLEHEALEDFAIRVEVAGNDRVMLHGEVDQASQAELAVETARALPGVERVTSEIEVRSAGGTGG